MNTSFIPELHFVPPSEKLTSEWCDKVIQFYYRNTNNLCLLQDKRVWEIENYASGNIDMKPFKRLYKSIKKKMDQNSMDGNINSTTNYLYNNGNVNDDEMQFNPLPLIPTPLNSAQAILQKIPVEITCTALDALAATKKKEDVTFLKNKPQVENDINELTSQMNVGKIDLGSTSHSNVPFSDSPYGLNLNDPDEYSVFVDLLYKLGVETCFETALQIWWEIKNGSQTKLMEIKDQYKYGVSCNEVFDSVTTGLPDMKYEYPGNVFAPYSELPDYSDNTHRFSDKAITPMELFNYFGDEICNQATLENIVIGDTTGYCACNGVKDINSGNYGSYKMRIVKFQIRTVDYVNISGNPKSKKGFKFITSDVIDNESCKGKIWGQNTYEFFWLKNTRHFFGIHKLGYAYRTVGQESYQNFSTNIYKSQNRSAVENSIGENKKAQIASIKLDYAIIQSRPSGVYIDLKYLRGAVDGLTDGNNKETLDQLTALALERNVMIGDSTDFDDKPNAGQFKPFQEIQGGLRTEVQGYIQVILSAQQNIASFTGINQQLTGQSQNPDTLIGLQKLQINQSINALEYSREAINMQYQKVMNQWGYSIKEAVKKGGKPKEAIVNLIGSRKVDIIDRLDELPLHDMGIKISLTQREEERAKFEQRVYALTAQGVLTDADIYMLENISNPKDQYALLAVKQKQWQKRQDIKQQQQYAQQQQLSQQAGQNIVAGKQAVADGEIKKEYAKGDVASKLIPLQQQTNFQKSQYEAQLQKSLQSDKTQGQIEEALQKINAKASAEQQKALV